MRGPPPPSIGPITEAVYCKLYALDGVWSPWFLHQIRCVFKTDRVPDRFVKRAAEFRKELERARSE